ncbi:hypothetical protein V1291_000077 [Nitrobacteraceae bacterium AZCC 1564]
MTRPFPRLGRPVLPPSTDDRGDSEFIPVYAMTRPPERNWYFTYQELDGFKRVCDATGMSKELRDE